MSQKVARVYLRVSSEDQDIERQKRVVEEAKKAGYYIAAVYTEKASGARPDRPELTRMISDIQPGDVIIAEKMDRISRLPLAEAEILIERIKSQGARLAIPGVTDFTDLINDTQGVAKVVLEAMQELLLKLALQMAREDYEVRRERQKQGIDLAKEKGKYKGRKANTVQHDLILTLRPHHTIAETARLAGCSQSQVKRICSLNNKSNKAT